MAELKKLAILPVLKAIVLLGMSLYSCHPLKVIYPEFQVIRGFSQKIPAGVLSYDQIHS